MTQAGASMMAICKLKPISKKLKATYMELRRKLFGDLDGNELGGVEEVELGIGRERHRRN